MKVKSPIEPLASTTDALAELPLNSSAPMEAERSKVAVLVEAPAKELPALAAVALNIALDADTPVTVSAPEPSSEKLAVEAETPRKPMLAEGAKFALEALEPTIPIPPLTGTMALEVLDPEKAMLALKPKEALLAEVPVKARRPVAVRGKTAALAEAPGALRTPIVLALTVSL